jgi:hypothetical protein
MSSNNNNKETLKIRGYRADNFTYSAKTESYEEVHSFDLTLEKLPMLPLPPIEHYLSNDSFLVSGSQGQPIKLKPDAMYFSDFLFLPTHLVQRRHRNVKATELQALQYDTQQREGILWAGKIRGASPINELLTGAIGPEALQGLHPAIPDNQKNLSQFYPLYATIDPNEKDSGDSGEEFYKPFTYYRPIYAGGHCKRVNCPLCRPVEKYKDELLHDESKRIMFQEQQRRWQFGKEREKQEQEDTNNK